jgi:hypothetical protein
MERRAVSKTKRAKQIFVRCSGKRGVVGIIEKSLTLRYTCNCYTLPRTHSTTDKSRAMPGTPRCAAQHTAQFTFGNCSVIF